MNNITDYKIPYNNDISLTYNHTNKLLYNYNMSKTKIEPKKRPSRHMKNYLKPYALNRYDSH